MRLYMMAALATVVLTPTAALADGKSPFTPYALTSTSYAQNFNSLAATGNSNSLPAGFQIVEIGGTAADGRYVAGDGSSNAGGIYSFGTGTSTDRALGSVGSGSASPLYFGGVFSNGMADTINAITLAFTGEQWRAGNSANDGLVFEYSFDATALDNGTWLTFSALDFAPIVLSGGPALDGNAPANGKAISATISGFSITTGKTFGFRWKDMDSNGTDHGLAVDDLNLQAGIVAQPGAVPEPASWAMLLAGFGALGATMRRSPRRVAFA
jgi:hypothetical protein